MADTSFPWHVGIADAHCHPTDTMSSTVNPLIEMKTQYITIMATRIEDQGLVASVADRCGIPETGPEPNDQICRKVVPCFGWHPWFSHMLSDERLPKKEHYLKVLKPAPKDDESFLAALPDPKPLSEFIATLRSNLATYPTALVGEIGLDKVFALPQPWTPEQLEKRDDMITKGGRENRRLSPYHVNPEHQKLVFKAQLNLAGEMRRAVSIHGVQAHGAVLEVLRETWKGYEKEVVSNRTRKRRGSVPGAHSDEEQEYKEKEAQERKPKPFPSRICLHSYSGPPESLREYLHASVPAQIFFSFSMLVNFNGATNRKSMEVIKAIPDDRILVESDWHMAGPGMDRLMREIVLKVCEIKKWDLANGARQLRTNWFRFIFDQDPHF